MVHIHLDSQFDIMWRLLRLFHWNNHGQKRRRGCPMEQFEGRRHWSVIAASFLLALAVVVVALDWMASISRTQISQDPGLSYSEESRYVARALGLAIPPDPSPADTRPFIGPIIAAGREEARAALVDNPLALSSGRDRSWAITLAEIDSQVTWLPIYGIAASGAPFYVARALGLAIPFLAFLWRRKTIDAPNNGFGIASAVMSLLLVAAGVWVLISWPVAY